MTLPSAGVWPRFSPALWPATATAAGLAVLAACGFAEARDLSVRVLPPAVTQPPAADLPSLPTPNPFGPGGPPWPSPPNIVDGQTRFLAAGPAQARCPHDRILFVSGVVDPYRQTAPGDGAFMCRADAIAEGYVGE